MGGEAEAILSLHNVDGADGATSDSHVGNYDDDSGRSNSKPGVAWAVGRPILNHCYRAIRVSTKRSNSNAGDGDYMCFVSQYSHRGIHISMDNLDRICIAGVIGAAKVGGGGGGTAGRGRAHGEKDGMKRGQRNGNGK